MLNLKKIANYKINEGPLKVESLKSLAGANYFSAGAVIIMVLNLREYDEVFSDSINGFGETLQKYIPSLEEHFCSIGKKGGFLQRVKEGTLLGHIIEHCAIELQTLSGMDVGFGKTRMTTKQGVYNVVVRFFDEFAGIYALKIAVNLINAILLKKEFLLEEKINILRSIRNQRLLGPTTKSIIDEAQKRNIPAIRLDEYNLIQLGTGKFQSRIRAALTDKTNFIAVEIADDKFLTYKMLSDADLPVEESKLLDDFFKIEKLSEMQKIVIKPTIGNSGKGISILNYDPQKIKKAKLYSQKFSEETIVQNFVEGNSYRLLIIDYKFVAALRMNPPTIKGDGKITIKNLIDNLNSDFRRGDSDFSKLCNVKVDEQTKIIFENNNLNEEIIIEKNVKIKLKYSGSFSVGGSFIDVTDRVHPKNKFYAEKAAKTIGLNVAGIDIITENIREDILKNKGKIIEINSAPDLKIHQKPTEGKARKPEQKFIDMIFKKDKPSRIPLFSITGNEGKTATTEFIYFILKKHKINVAVINSKGFLSANEQFPKNTKPFSHQVKNLLTDNNLEAGIIATPLKSILEEGLNYEFADYGIVLNIGDNFSEHQIYLQDKEDISYAKSVVAEQVYEDGYTILNADDEFVLSMRKRCDSQILLFSQNEKTITDIINKKEKIVFLSEEGQINYFDGQKIYIVLNSILTSKILNNTKNTTSLLAGICAIICFGISYNEIKDYCQNFVFNEN